jgi:hypothetical protein
MPSGHGPSPLPDVFAVLAKPAASGGLNGQSRRGGAVPGSAGRVTLELQQKQRARLLYSVRDFQIARCAAEFLAECKEERPSLSELRRFRCYETTMIIAYARPFSVSHGKVPRLSLEMAGAELTDEQNRLHERVLRVRNIAIAHSDATMMRALSEAEFFSTVFDEGLEFIGPKLHELRNLIEIVYGSVFTKLFGDAQPPPAAPPSAAT